MKLSLHLTLLGAAALLLALVASIAGFSGNASDRSALHAQASGKQSDGDSVKIGGVEMTPWEQPEYGESVARVNFEGGVNAYLDCEDERVEVLAEMLAGVSRPLEFLIVGRGGASHEALMQIQGKPFDLHQALELLGLVPAAADEKLRYRGDSRTPKGDKVRISVVWTADDGARFETPIEDWIFNTDSGKTLTRGPWVFSGSSEDYREDIGRSLYLADQVSNVVGLWRDPSVVLDNPRPSGVLDRAFRVNAVDGAFPQRYRDVVLIFRKWSE